MIELTLYCNVAAFVALICIKFQKDWHAKLAVFVWTAFMILLFYYMVELAEGSNPFFGIWGLRMPLVAAVPIAAAMLLLTIRSKRIWAARLVLLFVLAGLASFVRYIPGIDPLSYGTGTFIERVLILASFLIAFLLAVLVPLTAFVDGQISLFRRFFFVSWSHLASHWRPVLAGAAMLLGLYLIVGLILEGGLFRIHTELPFQALIMRSLLMIFLYILLDHFVCIGLAKYIVDELFKGQETTMWEIVLYAGIYAGFHYYFVLFHIVFAFVVGLVLSYLYLRTRSLFYGIVLQSLFWIFVK